MVPGRSRPEANMSSPRVRTACKRLWKRKGPGRHVGRKLTQGMPGCHGDPPQPFSHYPVHRNGMNEEGRLGVLREREFLLWSLPRQAGEMKTQDVVGFLEQLLGLGKGQGELPAHTHELGPLSRE